MPHFTFVTYKGLPDLDPDDRLAAEALARRGYAVKASVWNDSAVDWAGAGICVIRSTWDYHLAYRDFLRWAERTASVTQLWNPLPIVRWNSHKSYLRDLERQGAPVVPTAWLQAGCRADVPALLEKRGWPRVVIKPAVGLATRGVLQVDARTDGAALDRAQRHVDALTAEGDVMIQPYMASVDEHGERALVFIGGRFSHAVRKTAFQPLAPAGEAGEEAARADSDEIAVAERVASLAPGPTLYARVDLVRDDAGMPLVIEFELVEPSLFLSLDPGAPEKFADALAALGL